MTALAPKSDCNLAAAREFLQLLDPAAKFFTFQTFDDVELPGGKKRGDKSLAGIFHGTLAQHAEALMDYNRRGAGVFVTINGTDGKGRKKGNITRVRAVWHEDDTGLDRIFPLLPNLITESSPGKKHRYWFVDEMMLPEHAELMRIMVEAHGSDPNAADLSRVLRLPGFFHNKNPERPHLVRIIGGTAWPAGFGVERYPRGELLTAFGFVRQERPEKVTPERAPGAFDRAKLFQAVGHIPAEDRATWLLVGMGLHYETGGSFEGRELWATWSENAPVKFDADDLERVWASFKGKGGELITAGTIYHLAQANGWKGDVGAKMRVFDEISPALGHQPQSGGGLVVQRAADVEPKKLEWIWLNRIAKGKCNLLAGEMALGKTTVLLYIIARITTGTPWPCGEGCAPHGSVIYCGSEDDFNDTVVPRLMACGADLSKVHFVRAVRLPDGKGQRSFSLATDLVELEKLIASLGDVVLVILDPINSYFGKGTDTYRASDVRTVLEPVSEMAARLGVSFLGNTHLTKDSKGRSMNHRILDSGAITQHARGTSFVMPDPDNPDVRLFIPGKGSNAKGGVPALTYTIQERAVCGTGNDTIFGTYPEWGTRSIAVTADEIAARSEKGRETPVQDAARAFLLKFLVAGPKPSAEVYEAARAHCVSPGTLRLAQQQLNIDPIKSGMSGGWIWQLPVVPLPAGF